MSGLKKYKLKEGIKSKGANKKKENLTNLSPVHLTQTSFSQVLICLKVVQKMRVCYW